MIIILFLLSCCSIQPISCETGIVYECIQELKNPIHSDTLSSRKTEWMVLPILFKSPDTGWAAGVLPQVVYRHRNSSNPSFLRLDAYYTQKKQYHLVLRSSNWILGNNLHLTGRISFKDWPTNFYGIGNQTSEASKISITERVTDIQTSVQRRIGKHSLIGAGYRFRNDNIRYPVESGFVFDPQENGDYSYQTSGISADFTYDSRDNHFFPSSGFYAQFKIFQSAGITANDSNFFTLESSITRYLNIYQNQVLALQAVSIHTRGAVPFRMLSSLGNNLRGYSSTRFIDKNLLAARIEYRFVPLVWRLGFTAFAGVGDVFNSFEDLSWNRLKFTVGAGIRFVFSSSEKVNIRLDYAFAKGSSGNYIDINEAY